MKMVLSTLQKQFLFVKFCKIVYELLCCLFIVVFRFLRTTFKTLSAIIRCATAKHQRIIPLASGKLYCIQKSSVLRIFLYSIFVQEAISHYFLFAKIFMFTSFGDVTYQTGLQFQATKFSTAFCELLLKFV